MPPANEGSYSCTVCKGHLPSESNSTSHNCHTSPDGASCTVRAAYLPNNHCPALCGIGPTGWTSEKYTHSGGPTYARRSQHADLGTVLPTESGAVRSCLPITPRYLLA
jgi:hypothetical protein